MSTEPRSSTARLVLILLSVFLLAAGWFVYRSWRTFPDPRLVGDWVGEIREEPGGPFTRWHAHRDADGTYVIVFRNYERDSYYDQRETGRWGCGHGTYRTVTLTSETVGKSPPEVVEYHESYVILDLTERAFTYRSVRTGTVFTVHRVPSDYVLPKVMHPPSSAATPPPVTP